jgi:hypothetical protein
MLIVVQISWRIWIDQILGALSYRNLSKLEQMLTVKTETQR